MIKFWELCGKSKSFCLTLDMPAADDAFKEAFTAKELVGLAVLLPKGTPEERIHLVTEIWHEARKVLFPPGIVPEFPDYPGFEEFLEHLMGKKSGNYRAKAGRENRFVEFMKMHAVGHTDTPGAETRDRVRGLPVGSDSSAALSDDEIQFHVAQLVEKMKGDRVMEPEKLAAAFREWSENRAAIGRSLGGTTKALNKAGGKRKNNAPGSITMRKKKPMRKKSASTTVLPASLRSRT